MAIEYKINYYFLTTPGMPSGHGVVEYIQFDNVTSTIVDRQVAGRGRNVLPITRLPLCLKHQTEQIR